MSQEQLIFRCQTCGRERTFERAKINHRLHAALSFVTGFWLLVWLFLGIQHRLKTWTCAVCKNAQSAPKPIPSW